MAHVQLEQFTQRTLAHLGQALQGHVHLEIKFAGGKEKSVKSFHLEECLYCCWSKLKTFSFSQGRGTMLVLSIPGEVFSFQARIVIKMKKTPQPQELKGTAVVIVPVGRI